MPGVRLAHRDHPRLPHSHSPLDRLQRFWRRYRNHRSSTTLFLSIGGLLPFLDVLAAFFISVVAPIFHAVQRIKVVHVRVPPPLPVPPVVLGAAGATGDRLQDIKDADYIIAFDNVRFYVPCYPLDGIQSIIVGEGRYFEKGLLDHLAYAVPEGSVVLDIGSNIGNHAIYWAVERRAQKVYAFEPMPRTFEILKRNIEINDLQHQIVILNVALSDDQENVSMIRYPLNNIGAAAVRKSPEGNIVAMTLDSFDVPEERVDFVKIDVENFERQVVNGGMMFLRKWKPQFIFMEILASETRPWMNEKLRTIGYTMCENLPGFNYLYYLGTPPDDNVTCRPTPGLGFQ
jgi:FkbM family methyltransferase